VIRTCCFILAAAVSAAWLALLAWSSCGRCDYRLTPSPSSVTSFHADVHSVELMHSWINLGHALPGHKWGWAMLGVRRARFSFLRSDGSMEFISSYAFTAPQIAMLPLAAVLPALATTRGCKRWQRWRRAIKLRPIASDGAIVATPI
jgi:hypothetical protein